MPVDKETCCGCSACASVCSRGAIEMVVDELGFLYPQVSEDKCIQCGHCEKVCPVNAERSNDHQRNEILEAYAVRHREKREVETSRSGAAFIAITDRVLQDGGVVYGAAYGNHFRVIHKRATNREQRNEFKGSKYTQSDLRGIYRQVLDDLQHGLSVAFSGTPCQTAAVRNTIPLKYRDHLLLIDIICHGVASPRVWGDYLKVLEKIENNHLVAVDFRDKQLFGWSGLHRESFTYADGLQMTYSKTFYQPFLIRRSCNRCPYASYHRPSDLTLGDFWGWERVVPQMNRDDKGLSLVLCHTKKGLRSLTEVQTSADIVPVSVESCLQPNLQHPTAIDSLRDQFEEEYGSEGFEKIYEKYFKERGLTWLKWYLKSCAVRVKHHIC